MDKKNCASQHFGAWACEPKWLRQALASVQAGTWKPTAADALDDEKPYELSGDTAIISIAGQITKGQSSFGGCSSVATRRALREAAADSSVRKIVMLIDSPGGTVAGTADLAADVASIDKRMPVYAYVEDLGASAAYWIASQARKIFAGPAAKIGSIGIMCVLHDTTGAQEKEGVKLTTVSTGEFKGMGQDGKVDEKLIAEAQREVDDTNAIFLKAIADGRGLNAKEVAAVADGRVWIADKAKQLGLIDEVASFDAAMTAISKEVTQMDRKQFDELLAEHPEWAASKVSEGKNVGVAETLASEKERAKAIRAVAGNDTLALDAFIAGQDAETVKVSAAAIAKATADADAKIKAQAAEIERLTALAGTQGPVGTAGAAKTDASASTANLEGDDLYEADWAADKDGCKAEFKILSAYRAYRRSVASKK